MFNITLNGKVMTLQKKTRILDLLKKDERNFVVCKVNNRLRELTYEIDSAADIQLIDLTSHDGMRVYEASLRYLFCMALKRVAPKVDVYMNQFISQSISCELINLEEPLTQGFVEKIIKEMEKIIAADFPIVRKTASKEEIMELYQKSGHTDKIKVIKYRPEQDSRYYECQEYIDYMYNYMVPSTGYLNKFKLRLFYPLLILQYPRYDSQGEIPAFQDSPKLCRVFRESDEWAAHCNAATISDINSHMENQSVTDFVNMCETKHNNMLCELGKMIYSKAKDIKIIAIAGPSSSGKTTFSNRLRIELMNKGLKPVMISIDNYYLPRTSAPLNEKGQPDLEHIEALDIKLFNEHMLKLISGEAVTLPIFNFKIGMRQQGKTIQLEKDSIIIIEGIHALNDVLTPLIPKFQKFKIYISPLTQVNIDDHNPISITDVRIIRRLVRDFKHRNTPALDTLKMWRSVRQGEYRWIYPHQEEADFIFNSELTYEFGVMKKYALPLLQAIPNDDYYFIIANRLIKFLKYFKDIPDELIPCNSLLREFIGGSCFE